MLKFYEMVSQYVVNHDPDKGPESEFQRSVWMGGNLPDGHDIEFARMETFNQPAVRSRVDLEEFSNSGCLLLIREQIAVRPDMLLKKSVVIAGVKLARIIDTIPLVSGMTTEK